MDTVSEFRKALVGYCKQYWKDSLRIPKRIEVQSLPLLTDKEFNGVPVRKVMSPPVPETGAETEALFDTWLWPHRSGEGNSVQDLTAASSKDLVQFVLRGGDFNEQTFRLMYALSNAPGARLEYDPASLMVHHGDKSYGIIDGTVFSRFCGGVKIKVDHERLLTETYPMVSGDAALCAIWRGAVRKRATGAVWAFIALWMGNPKFNWRRLLHRSRAKSKTMNLPTVDRFDNWVSTILSEIDPVAALYDQTVPYWLTKTEFGRVIVWPSRKPRRLTEATRNRYIARLRDFIYNKPKKEKE